MSMQLNLTLFPYLEPLLHVHEQDNQQPDNLCGPYWISLLLQAYGNLSVSAVEVALKASTILPSHGDPADWIPPSATSHLGPGYDRIPTVSDIAACGTSITGLIQATEQLSQGRFCLLPLQSNTWIGALTAVWHLCHTHPEWQVVPLLNPHTSYFLGSTLTPRQLFNNLESSAIASPPPNWSVGHFALLIGQLQGNANSLYALLDTYPHFGWNGIHLQPPNALVQSLQRPNQDTQGGIALFVASELRSRLEPLLENHTLKIKPWDNGTPT
ncbi:MAG: hypothetical protein AAF215_10980 [Cyanobacteria bacterium P01_A01_bin.123]